MEHEFLGHVISNLREITIDDFGKAEFYSETKTALKLVNEFRIEMGLQDYQRLNYRVQDANMIIFGNPKK